MWLVAVGACLVCLRGWVIPRDLYKGKVCLGSWFPRLIPWLLCPIAFLPVVRRNVMAGTHSREIYYLLQREKKREGGGEEVR